MCPVQPISAEVLSCFRELTSPITPERHLRPSVAPLFIAQRLNLLVSSGGPARRVWHLQSTYCLDPTHLLSGDIFSHNRRRVQKLYRKSVYSALYYTALTDTMP
jgi:hypothetical protein